MWRDSLLFDQYTISLMLYDIITTEYCGNEIFSPTCGHDEVIVMRHALYGRMKLGKCIKRDLGFIGCQTDILGILDTKCSNKHSCVVDPLNDLNFDERIHNPCSELYRYFEADYNCQKSRSINIIVLRVILKVMNHIVCTSYICECHIILLYMVPVHVRKCTTANRLEYSKKRLQSKRKSLQYHDDNVTSQ